MRLAIVLLLSTLASAQGMGGKSGIGGKAGFGGGPSGGGAISVVQVNGKNITTPTTTPSWSAGTVTVGNRLVIVVVSGSMGTTTAADSLGNFSGLTCTLAATSANVLYCVSAPLTTGGADTITLTCTSSNDPVAFALEVSGSSGGFDAAGTAGNNTAGTTWTLPTVTTTAVNDIVIGWGGNNSTNNTYTAGSGYTIPTGTCGSNVAAACGQGSGGNQSGFVEWQVVTTATGYSPTATLTSMAGSSETISLKP